MNMKKEFLAKLSRVDARAGEHRMSVLLPTSLAASPRPPFLPRGSGPMLTGVEVMVVRGEAGGSEGSRDVTRCQEYKAGDKGDGGHICDS